MNAKRTFTKEEKRKKIIDGNVFDHSIRKEERNQMEDAIRNMKIDLRAENIRKGSPHT